MSMEVLYEIKEQLGYMTGKIEGIEKHLEEQNGTIIGVKKQLSRHEVALGKVGIVFTGAIVALDFAVKATIGFFKDKT